MPLLQGRPQVLRKVSLLRVLQPGRPQALYCPLRQCL
jgi:hypothetical protein